MLQSLSNNQEDANDHFAGPVQYKIPGAFSDAASTSETFEGDEPAENTDLTEAVAAIRRQRVALRIQNQLLKNLQTADEELEETKQTLVRVQKGAAEAIEALQKANAHDLGASYERLREALQALEQETAEATVIADWHRETRRLYDHSKGETEKV